MQEKLSPQTLLTSAHRSVFMDKHFKEVLDKEMKEYKQTEASRMQKAFRKIILQLPGRCLDLPVEDKSVVVTMQEGTHDVVGVGPYTLGNMITEGGFGVLHVAQHKDNGDCMLRLIPKTDISRRLGDILQLDREVTIMTNLAAHPNIVKAHSVLNVAGYFVVSLENMPERSIFNNTRETFLRRTTSSLCPVGLWSTWRSRWP